MVSSVSPSESPDATTGSANAPAEETGNRDLERLDGPVDNEPFCQVREVRHAYEQHEALRGVDLDIHGGQITALLGPNGSGKTTLFRLIATLMPIQSGTVTIGGVDVGANPRMAREMLGVVFQSPSLDGKLTVEENIECQGMLYGIRGGQLRHRIDDVLHGFNLLGRRQERCEKLSGGLKRRVELAKSMLHRPRLMLLDEPSSGLDPTARQSLWSALQDLANGGTAVLLTTHLMEEAEKSDQLMLFSDGQKVAEGTPSELRSELGVGVMTVIAKDNDDAKTYLSQELGLDVISMDGCVRVLSGAGPATVRQVAERFGDDLVSVSFGRPSLEDVFVARTGTSFDRAGAT